MAFSAGDVVLVPFPYRDRLSERARPATCPKNQGGQLDGGLVFAHRIVVSGSRYRTDRTDQTDRSDEALRNSYRAEPRPTCHYTNGAGGTPVQLRRLRDLVIAGRAGGS